MGNKNMVVFFGSNLSAASQNSCKGQYSRWALQQMGKWEDNRTWEVEHCSTKTTAASSLVALRDFREEHGPWLGLQPGNPEFTSAAVLIQSFVVAGPELGPATSTWNICTSLHELPTINSNPSPDTESHNFTWGKSLKCCRGGPCSRPCQDICNEAGRRASIVFFYKSSERESENAASSVMLGYHMSPRPAENKVSCARCLTVPSSVCQQSLYMLIQFKEDTQLFSSGKSYFKGEVLANRSPSFLLPVAQHSPSHRIKRLPWMFHLCRGVNLAWSSLHMTNVVYMFIY